MMILAVFANLIAKDVNTFVYVGRSKKKVFDHPKLNGDLETLCVMVKDYYKTHIMVNMLEYELVK